MLGLIARRKAELEQLATQLPSPALIYPADVRDAAALQAAAISYLESLRVELRGSGVKVITICPGYIVTAMTAQNPYPMPFLLSADAAARKIAGIIDRGKTFAVIPWQMAVVARLLRVLPNRLYDWLLGRAPRKPRGAD